MDDAIFGYTTRPPPELIDNVLAYMSRSHSVDLPKEWLVWVPTMMEGIKVALACTGTEQDNVMTSTPVYYPFLTAMNYGNKTLNAVPLRQGENARWTFDWEAMETAVTPDTSAFLLCNPHNPVGRCFARSGHMFWMSA